MTDTMTVTAESGSGKLYDAGGFLVPVLSGSHREMGRQYGELMAEAMQQTYDLFLQPAHDEGLLTDDAAETFTQRALTSFSIRNRELHAGIVEGTGWPASKVGILDQFWEWAGYQANIHTFAGCTTIFSWGDSSSDGNMYIGRNMDWSAHYNMIPQVLTVLNPTDGWYRYANLGWPGMYGLITGLNEHGVYADIHDGSSMGGNIVFLDRAPFLQALADMVAETASLDALLRRLSSHRNSLSFILSLADEAGAASLEAPSWDARSRFPTGDSFVTVNTYLNPDWGIHVRDTVSHSLERYENMTARLAENHGSIDAARVRDLMDLTLFDADGALAEHGGATKPTKQDADQTTHQMVTDVANRKVWLKVPNPDYLTDWIPVDLRDLWGSARP